jgi:hypothetical protein
MPASNACTVWSPVSPPDEDEEEEEDDEDEDPHPATIAPSASRLAKVR